LNDANEQLKKKKIARNIFPNQLIVFRSLATEYQLSIKDGLPEISYHFVESFSRSRVNYKNQWASHPTLQERKISLDRLAIYAAPDETSAWQLFEQAETLQENMTVNLYRSVTFEEQAQTYEAADFEERYRSQKMSQSLPPIYKGFYDGRYIAIKEWDIDAPNCDPSLGDFDKIFGGENGKLQSSINSNKNDLEILRAIQQKKIAIKNFDFDGIKYSVADCSVLILQLQDEIEGQFRRQQELDKAVFVFSLQHRDDERKDLLKSDYRRFQSISIRYEEYVATVNQLLARVQPFYAGAISLSQINTILDLLKKNEELALKSSYQQLLEEGLLTATPESPGDLSGKSGATLSGEIRDFLQKNYAYLLQDVFLDNELNELTGLARRVAQELGRQQFECYKKMLEAQAEGFNTARI
jgi:hypothetical protein